MYCNYMSYYDPKGRVPTYGRYGSIQAMVAFKAMVSFQAMVAFNAAAGIVIQAAKASGRQLGLDYI